MRFGTQWLLFLSGSALWLTCDPALQHTDHLDEVLHRIPVTDQRGKKFRFDVSGRDLLAPVDAVQRFCAGNGFEPLDRCSGPLLATLTQFHERLKLKRPGSVLKEVLKLGKEVSAQSAQESVDPSVNPDASKTDLPTNKMATLNDEAPPPVPVAEKQNKSTGDQKVLATGGITDRNGIRRKFELLERDRGTPSTAVIRFCDAHLFRPRESCIGPLMQALARGGIVEEPSSTDSPGLAGEALLPHEITESLRCPLPMMGFLKVDSLCSCCLADQSQRPQAQHFATNSWQIWVGAR